MPDYNDTHWTRIDKAVAFFNLNMLAVIVGLLYFGR